MSTPTASRGGQESARSHDRAGVAHGLDLLQPTHGRERTGPEAFGEIGFSRDLLIAGKIVLWACSDAIFYERCCERDNEFSDGPNRVTLFVKNMKVDPLFQSQHSGSFQPDLEGT